MFLPKTAWIIEESKGWYDDREESILGVFTSQKRAIAWLEKSGYVCDKRFADSSFVKPFQNWIPGKYNAEYCARNAIYTTLTEYPLNPKGGKESNE